MKKKDSPNIGDINLHIKTALQETGDNWEFLLGDFNNNGILDLYYIQKYNNQSNSTEVHILDGNDNFQSFLLQTGTALHETGNNWEFLLGDHNNNGILDLYCINTQSNSTEVHILNGNDTFQSFLLQTGTALLKLEIIGNFY